MSEFELTDCHVHVGKWSKKELLISPKKLVDQLGMLGVKKFVVSSTSALCYDHNVVSDEMNKILELAPNVGMPLLWVRPKMLEDYCKIDSYYNFPVYGFKIHGYADKWDYRGKQINRLFKIADEMSLPVLAHTGYKEVGPEAFLFSEMAFKYPDVKLVLAHGRPDEQALFMIANYANVYLDTAFTSDYVISLAAKNGFSDKIIFGTDYPVEKFYFPKSNLISRYKMNVDNFITKFGIGLFDKCTKENFFKVFNPNRYGS
jgi:predicted TIM-barrel fold metal-dependent hydrolase